MRWTGDDWVWLTPTNPPDRDVQELGVLPDGNRQVLYGLGFFPTGNPADPSTQAARWTGTAWEPIIDPERRIAMGAAGRERTLERYAVDRLVDDVDALYRDLLAARSSKAPASSRR